MPVSAHAFLPMTDCTMFCELAKVTLHEALPLSGGMRKVHYSFAGHMNQSRRSKLQEARSPFSGLVSRQFPQQSAIRMPGVPLPDGYHRPLQWVSSKRLHPDIGNIVALFRKPSQRILSAWHYMRKHRGCCAIDWGLSRRHAERARQAKTAASFALLPGMRGCQTKMLLGRQCCDLGSSVATLGTRIPSVVRLIEERVAFVGLLEEFDLSVCLWHARFGGPLFTASLMDTRPTARKAPDSEPHHYSHATHYNESELGGVEDAADERIYAAAKRRFERDVRAHEEQVALCMQSVRKLTAAL